MWESAKKRARLQAGPFCQLFRRARHGYRVRCGPYLSPLSLSTFIFTPSKPALCSSSVRRFFSHEWLMTTVARTHWVSRSVYPSMLHPPTGRWSPSLHKVSYSSTIAHIKLMNVYKRYLEICTKVYLEWIAVRNIPKIWKNVCRRSQASYTFFSAYLCPDVAGNRLLPLVPFTTCSNDRLLTCTNHFNRLYVVTLPDTFGCRVFAIVSRVVSHIHLSILVSFTANLFSPYWL